MLFVHTHAKINGLHIVDVPIAQRIHRLVIVYVDQNIGVGEFRSLTSIVCDDEIAEIVFQPVKCEVRSENGMIGFQLQCFTVDQMLQLQLKGVLSLGSKRKSECEQGCCECQRK